MPSLPDGFGVVQSSWDATKGSVKKIRPIDDFTESLANQASRPNPVCCESGGGAG